MDKKKALNQLAKHQKNKKQKKHQFYQNDSSDDNDFIDQDVEYSGDYDEEYDQDFKNRKKKQNMMRLMASDMIAKNKEKKQDVKLDKKKADDILENLFAEDEQNEQMEEEDQQYGQDFNGIGQYQNLNQNSKKRSRIQHEESYTKSAQQQKIQEEEESIGFEGVENLLKLDAEQKQQQEQKSIQLPGNNQIMEEEASISMNEIEQMIQKDKQQQQNQVIQQQQQQKQFIKQQGKMAMDKLIMTQIKQNQNIDDIKQDDGSLNVFFIDLFEDEKQRKGKLYLIGKVYNKKTKEYESITLIIQNNIREIYFVPNDYEKQEELEAEVKDILERRYLRLRPDYYSGNFQKLKYSFELDIPRGKSKFYTVQYPFEYDTLPSDLTGQNFKFVLGTTYTALELFLLKKELMGPQWINIQNYQIPKRAAESNSRFEFDIHNFEEDIQIIEHINQPKQPQLKCMSIALKSFRNPQKNDQLEILELSMLLHNKINTDSLTDMVGYFKKSFIRPHVQGKQLPYDFEKRKGNHITQVTSEFAILQGFLDFVAAYDPDIIVGHDIYGEIMDVIMTRIEKNGVKASKMARLCNLPLNIYKGASNANKIRSLTKGRLIVDTYLQAKELVRDTDYNLTQMVQKHLNKKREEINITYENLNKIYDNSQTINELVNYVDRDAQYTLELMFKLQVVPLTKQLTNIAGNIWNRSLQNQRAERNEMLLMHQFYRKGYIVPDKYRKKFGQDNNDDENKNKKKYAGGMVFEPKSGYYEDFILLLDFNSLYPSIIQEFNLCFSTVERPSLSLQYYHGYKQQTANKAKKGNKGKKLKQQENPEDKMEEEEEEGNQTKNKNNKKEQVDDYDYPDIPAKSLAVGILPKTIKYLVEQRKIVKSEMKNQKDEQLKKSLDIKQLAFKLVANSMYGCLGFESSRFYAKPIAALITKQGREILKNSYDMVHKMNYEVIYGDTDSLMIYPKTNILNELFKIGSEIKKQVSKQYKNLVFDIDGVYKNMLLLKKKKYACLKLDNFGQIMQNPTEKQIWKKELKGLDIVRRDWSVISKTVGNEILDIILQENNGNETRDIVSEIYGKLNEIKEKIDNGQYPTSEYYIQKVLTKDPSAYPDGKALPHVAVAKRLIQSGKKQAVALIGKVIYFLVCQLPPAEDGSNRNNGALSSKCFAPEEVAENKYQLDFEYYKSNQILSVVERMVNVLPNMSRKQLAESLGLDGSKYQNREIVRNDEDTYQDECEDEHNMHFQNAMQKGLQLKCFNCQNQQVFKGLLDISTVECSKCKTKFPLQYISNKIRIFVRNNVQEYNKNKIICCKGTCANPYEISQFYLNRQPCQQCYQGKYEKSYAEKHLQIILKGTRGFLDTEKNAYKNKALDKTYRELFKQQHDFLDNILEKSNYEHIDLLELFQKANIIF